MTLTHSAIEALAEFSAPKEIGTRNGPKLLRKAKPTAAFEAAWAADERALRAAGISFGFDRYANSNMVNWWLPLPEAVKAARAEAVEASRAAFSDADLPRPAGLDYRPFQKAGIQYGLARPNVFIGDEMGLGKTIQAIGIVNADETVRKVIVICPKTLKRNWRDEWSKWSVRPMLVAVVDKVFPTGADVVIINYDIVKKHHSDLVAFGADALIIDEAHLIKNAKTLRSTYILGRAADEKKGTTFVAAIPARRHIRLSGTPIVNRPAELYNLIADLHPDWREMGFFRFAKRYANAHHNGFGWDFSGSSNLGELQTKLRETCLVRRLKSDVLKELPAKIRQVIQLEAETAEQKRVVAADRAAEEKRATLREAVEAARGNDATYKAAVAALEEAEEVAFEEMSRLRHEAAVAAMPSAAEYILGLLEDDDEKKVIVGAHHHDVISGLVAIFEGAGLRVVTLTGETKDDDRAAAVAAFQKDPTVRVFIGSIQAAGMGITLTASSTVAFVEESWVPGEISQFEDRAHRIGQTDTVLVYHLVLAGTVAVHMIKTTIAKQEVIEKALDVAPPALPEWKPRSLAEVKAPAPAASEPAAAALPIAAEPSISAEARAAILAGLKMLAGDDPDGARELNGAGFNKMDSAFGHSLAGRSSLTDKQAAAGARLVRKYRRQLPADLLAVALGEAVK